MSGSEHQKTLSNLVELIESSVASTGFTSRRCMFATTLVMEFAERLGFETLRWEGSVIWHNRKYMELKESGYDFKKLSQLPESKREKRLDALEKRGMRVLRCMANEGDPEHDLGGHLCVIARIGGECFFVDPTVRQFEREPEPPHRTGRIQTPDYIVAPIKDTAATNINFGYRYLGGLGVYAHEPVIRYRELLARPEREREGTGLNPHRFPSLYQTIEQALGLTPIKKDER